MFGFNRAVLYGISGVVTIAILVGTSIQLVNADATDAKIKSKLADVRLLSDATLTFKDKDIEKPDWYKDQEKSSATKVSLDDLNRRKKQGNGRVIAYTVSTKGATSSDLATFSSQANQTLNDPRGWAGLGISFKEVISRGEFNLILSEPSQLTTFSSACSSDWSCRVGASVVINDMRWSDATPAWNSAGGNIRDYRHMVINH